MAGVVTRKFRKFKLLQDEIKDKASQNSDLIWYLLFVFFGALSVLLFSVLFVWFLLWLGWLNIEALKPSILKLVGLFLTSAGAILSAIFGAYSKSGSFLSSLRDAGNKPKSEIDNNGYSVSSTYLRGSSDVVFEQTTEKTGDPSS
jgi:hypothetical protein